MTTARLLLPLAAVLAAAGTISAAPLQYFTFNNAGSGSVTPVASPSSGGGGSLQLSTTGAADKAAASFFQAGFAPLGTLGGLQSLSFDYLVSSSSTTLTTNDNRAAPAVRLFTNAGLTQGLVWERSYQPGGQTPTPTDMFQTDVDVRNGNFWQRANGQNFNGGSDAHPLSYYIAGNFPAGGAMLGAGTPIYGIEVSFGSGISGSFTGYIDNLSATFNGDGGPRTYTAFAAAAIPEPATLAVFAGLAGVGGLVARRRRAA
jgi:hypothetical protein